MILVCCNTLYAPGWSPHLINPTYRYSGQLTVLASVGEVRLLRLRRMDTVRCVGTKKKSRTGECFVKLADVCLLATNDGK